MKKFIAEYGGAMVAEDGALVLSFVTRGEEKRNAIECAQECKKLKLDGKERLTLEIKEFRKQRSLSANAYFHLLVGKIANEMNLGEDEVKVNMVLDYGTVATDDEGATVGIKLPVSVKATSVYPYPKWFDTRMENGKKFNCYILYKQTHTLDTAEMARLIDGVVYEAQQYGIETATPDEIAKMVSLHKAEV